MLMKLFWGDLFACTLTDPPKAVQDDRECPEFKRDLMVRQKNILKYLRGATTVHRAWSRLCHAFEDKGVFRRAALLQKLVTLKQETTLTRYVLEYREVVNQIAETGKPIEDELTAVLHVLLLMTLMRL